MLDLRIQATPVPDSPQSFEISDFTVGYGGENPARLDVALVLAVEQISESGAAGRLLVLDRYDPLTFLQADGSPIRVTVDQDGVYRIVVAAIRAYDPLGVSSLSAGEAYADIYTGGLYVRGTGLLSEDAPLTGDMLLGTAEVLQEVLAFTSEVVLSNHRTRGDLERLNLRYLALPYHQQESLSRLYNRVELALSGADTLFDQGRVLDAAAVLRGANAMILTNGQTPDLQAPLLSGYGPTNV